MNTRFVPILLLVLLCHSVVRADDTTEKKLPNVVILATGGTIAGSGATIHHYSGLQGGNRAGSSFD